MALIAGVSGRAFRDQQVRSALKHAGFELAPVMELDAYRLLHLATRASVDISACELMVEPATDTVHGMIAAILRLAHRRLMEHAASTTLTEIERPMLRQLSEGEADGR